MLSLVSKPVRPRRAPLNRAANTIGEVIRTALRVLRGPATLHSVRY